MPNIHGTAKWSPGGFYDLPESTLARMARAHFSASESARSSFSSWAASLHLIISDAKYMGASAHPQVAVMDTHELEDEVFVWHVPHLLGETGYYEYLAYGRIRGHGYYAVSLCELERHGLRSIFPEFPQVKSLGRSGRDDRDSIFKLPDSPVQQNELHVIRSIASLFRNLGFPIATALVSLRPSLWRHWRIAKLEKGQYGGSSDEVRRLAKEVRIIKIPEG
jgi:hypothetical protein